MWCSRNWGVRFWRVIKLRIKLKLVENNAVSVEGMSLKAKSKSVIVERDQSLKDHTHGKLGTDKCHKQYEHKVHWQYLCVCLQKDRTITAWKLQIKIKNIRYPTSSPLGMWSWDGQNTASCWEGHWGYIFQAHWIPVFTENMESLVNQSTSIPEDLSRCEMEDTTVILVEIQSYMAIKV